jgi:cytochrome c oxidase cbb3-type subunit 1
MNPRTPTDRPGVCGTNVVAQAAWHGLFWLVAANGVGLLLAVLLLVPGLNSVLGEWTYGRWMMVHMNLELYGWTSLPLVGYLFHIYGTGRGSAASWCRPVLWVWSGSLGVGVVSWLTGHSSGKLFLDWSGYARFLFSDALLTLWFLLVIALVANWRTGDRITVAAWAARLSGLTILLSVPFALLIASSPNGYPPINPSTGGPTGASQLESSLAIVLIALMLPLGIARRMPGDSRTLTMAWILLVVHAVFCATLGRADISHHAAMQYIGFGTILIWLPILPMYYRTFEWHRAALRWRTAVLWWWAALLVTGTIMFFPGVLDHFKFTDGLVGHSFVAMAGFASSLIILVMVQLLGDGAWIFNRARTFYLWHGAVIAYIIVVTIAGWREGFDPAFTIVPGIARSTLYLLRLITGIVMLYASIDWLAGCTALLREPKPASELIELEKTA